MGALIYEDTLQQVHGGDKHAAKHEWWAAHGVEVVRTRFDGRHGVPWSFGDYCADGSNVVVDTKQHLSELSSNLGREHGRFKGEIRRANEDGCLLVVLVESGEVHVLDEVRRWVNAHCRRCAHFYRKACAPLEDGVCLKHGTKKPLQGEVMAKQIATMQATRSVRFEFCEPDDSARRICELLGVRYDNDEQRQVNRCDEILH